MPNTKPAIDTPDTVRYILDKAAEADAHVYVAAAITKGLQSNELDDLEALREAGAIALSDDGRPVVDSRLMARAMRAAPGLGLRVVSHCEDLDLSKGGLMNEGDVSRELGVPGVPAAAEDCGTARDIALAEAYPVSYTHLKLDDGSRILACCSKSFSKVHLLDGISIISIILIPRRNVKKAFPRERREQDQ